MANVTGIQENVCTIIPARGGSKRVPGKNLLPLAGKPLIVWSIETALKDPLAGVPWVTTDDAAIAEVAEKAGARVIIRPTELAEDITPTKPVVLHALEASGTGASLIVLLQPTSPFRPISLITEAVSRLEKANADAIIGVSRSKMAPEWHLREANHWLCPPDAEAINRIRTQDQPVRYLINGALYVYRTDWYRSGENLPFPAKTLPLVLETPYDLDIDTPADVLLAQCVASSYDFNR